MVRPRFATSVLTGVGVVSSFRGVYARVAHHIKSQPVNGLPSVKISLRGPRRNSATAQSLRLFHSAHSIDALSIVGGRI
jgi:hypothetical protein